MPGCHPASSEFLRSCAYAVESSGVVRVGQYRETVCHMQFLLPLELAIPMKECLYNLMILSMVRILLFGQYCCLMQANNVFSSVSAQTSD